MPRRKKRMTLAEAKALYPDEWVVFVEPRIDEENTSFIDGVLAFHCKDQQEAYERGGKLKGDRARFYTGSIPYRKVTLSEDNAGGKKVA